MKNTNKINAKNHKKFYDRWEFWVIVVLLIATIVPTIMKSTGSSSTSKKSSKSSESLVINDKRLNSAIKDAEIYAEMDLSKQGIYNMLTYKDSPDKHYDAKTAKKAVDQLKIDWNKKALDKAESLIENEAFSKKDLFKTLSNKDGYQFTDSEAKYAIKHLKKVDWNEMALKEAKDLFEYDPLSKKKLYKRLTDKYSKQFTPSEAQYAIDHIEVDWNEQALEAAKEQLKHDSNSKKSLYESLTDKYSQQFEPEQAQYAVDHIEADWNEQALKEAKQELKYAPLSKSGLYEALTDKYSKKFEPEQAQYAVDNIDVDWKQMALKKAKELKKYSKSKEDLKESLTSNHTGFTDEEADYAVNNLDK